MEKVKNTLGIVLVAFLCAYTVDGISQKHETHSSKEVVIIKKSIDKDGIEKVEKNVYSGDEISDQELEKLISDDIGSEVNVEISNSKGKESIEIFVNDSNTSEEYFEDAKVHAFLKSKGIDSKDIKTMNINSETASENGINKSFSTISLITNNGEEHFFNLPDDIDLGHSSNEIFIQGQPSKPRMGIIIGESDHGVLIEEIISGSPAEKAGLTEGDIIYAIGEETTMDIESLLSIVKKSGERNIVSFIRDGNKMNTPIQFTDFETDAQMKSKTIKKIKITSEKEN